MLTQVFVFWFVVIFVVVSNFMGNNNIFHAVYLFNNNFVFEVYKNSF